MFHPAITSCFLLTTILHTGQSAVIETKETVWAAEGDQASLSCRLTEDKDVLQITWQKVIPGGEKSLATYTKKFGSRVRPDIAEKMDFQCESLQSCSMVIRKVMEEDEGCYRCLFNTYPKGALIGWTCLKLYELHGPFINISRSNSPPGSVVTCSATGRPVPMVTLTVLHQNLDFVHYNTSRVRNTNGTVTFTTTSLLSALSSTQVECSVLVQTAAVREMLVSVPGLTETSDDGLDAEPGSGNIIIVGVSVAGFVLVFCAFVAALKFMPVRKQAEKRDHKGATNINPVMNDEALDELNKTLMDGKEKENNAEERMEENSVKEDPVVSTVLYPSLYLVPNLTQRHNATVQQLTGELKETSLSKNVNHGKKTN